MDLLVVRHGETVANTLNHYYGFTDSPVTEKGRIQAEAAGTAVKRMGYKPDEIYISQRKRTRETLKLMGFDPDKAHVDPRINEQNMGIFENKKYGEIEKQFPEYFKLWNDDFLHYRMPEGESRIEMYKRVKSFFKDMVKLYGKTDKKILIVCHGGVMNSFYTYLIGENFDESYSAYFGNCSMLKVSLMSEKLVIQSLITAEEFVAAMNFKD